MMNSNSLKAKIAEFNKMASDSKAAADAATTKSKKPVVSPVATASAKPISIATPTAAVTPKPVMASSTVKQNIAALNKTMLGKKSSEDKLTKAALSKPKTFTSAATAPVVTAAPVMPVQPKIEPVIEEVITPAAAALLKKATDKPATDAAVALVPVQNNATTSAAAVPAMVPAFARHNQGGYIRIVQSSYHARCVNGVMVEQSASYNEMEANFNSNMPALPAIPALQPMPTMPAFGNIFNNNLFKF